MDNTLDSIRPSSVISQQGEMSYLFGRDPSILAFGQRPCPEKDAKKNLYSLYEVEEHNKTEGNESVNSDFHALQTVKVYLRMKPFPKKLKITQEEQDAYKIMNSTTLFTRLPAIDNNTSCVKRPNSSDIVCRKFTFTKTFGAETTQLELFEQAVKQQMNDFLAGQNSTIMTYGTTNSGKSYTLQGTTTSPGIIPRGLEFVFSNITPKSSPSYKPLHHCDVVALGPLERAQELEIKTKLLTFASVDKHHYITAYKEMQRLLQEESPIRPSYCNDAQYSVWVSFAEIYNETVFDLLSNECQKKRSPLKLATDGQGRAFIKGLKTICVNSGSEAYQVLMAGQYNLKVAATALNARSSRSHCIFTIKLLKYYKENLPDTVEVSTFAFCDLAGSERLKKTLNIGDRLKEAQNINTSLLVLGRCLKSIHEGQLTKQKVELVGPFRESKLTRLFQKALSGKEHMALIVNINPLPNLYIETQNVLNFSAIAKKIVIEEKAKLQKKNKSRFSQIVTQSIKTETDWDATEFGSEDLQNTVQDEELESIEPDDYEEILIQNARLKKEIALLKSATLTRDLQIRQEMADTYTAMMAELETDWKNRIKDIEEQQEDAHQWSLQQLDDFYKKKISQLSCRKRKRSTASEESTDEKLTNFDELEIENTRLASKVVLLKNNIKDLREKNKNLTIEKNEITFDLGLTKEDLKNVKNLLNAAQQDAYSDEDTRFYIEELKTQLDDKQKQVKKLKVFLNEAKDEYIAITTEVREKEYLLKEQEELIVENEEKIEELEDHLEQTNICLIEKTKAVESLEEKLESQTKKIIDSENKMQSMQDEINKLKNEKLMLLEEVKLSQKSAVSPNDVFETEADVSEENENSSKDEDYEICIKEELSSVLQIDLFDDAKDDIKNEEKAENEEKVDPDLEKELMFIRTENSALKQKLSQSTVEIQSLKGDLESAKIKLKDISDQICNLKLSRTNSEVDHDEHITQKGVGESVEIGCQVNITHEDIELNSNEKDVEHKGSQSVEIITSEKINQTSFIEGNAESNVSEELKKLTLKYDDLKSEYKEKCSRVEELMDEVASVKRTIDCDTLDELAELTVKYDDVKTLYIEKCLRVDQLLFEVAYAKETMNGHMLNELAELTVKYDDVKTKYKAKCLKVTELVEEVLFLRQTVECLEEEGDTNKIVIEEYKQSIELLQTELSLLMDNKKEVDQILQNSDSVKTILEEKITDYEQRLHVTQEELISVKDNHNQCMTKLMTVQEDFDKHATMCRNEHEQIIDDLKKELSLAKERNDIKSQCLSVHAAKITELETTLENVTELHEKITQLNNHLEKCQAEKNHLQRLLDDNNEKLMDLKDRLEHANEKERDKDAEISSLQKEMKRIIQKNEHEESSDKLMEREMKITIKSLTETKDLLSRREEHIEHLEMRIKSYEQNSKVLDLLQESAKERQVENERLRIVNEELKNCLIEKDREMETFMKNRDEMVAKYETLVKTQQDELEKYKKEAPKREDEVVFRERRGRPRKKLSPSKTDEIPVVDLSASDSKRKERNTALSPHHVEPLSDRKKNSRKKKLYMPEDESVQDIEPLESSLTVTPSSSQTRSLRSRRK